MKRKQSLKRKGSPNNIEIERITFNEKTRKMERYLEKVWGFSKPALENINESEIKIAKTIFATQRLIGRRVSHVQ